MLGHILYFCAYKRTPYSVEVDDGLHKQLGGNTTSTLDNGVDCSD